MAKRKPVNLTELQAAVTDERPALFKVERDRVLLGFLEKWTDTIDEEHPWKAFTPQFNPGRRPTPGTMVGVHYGKGGQKAAIDQLAG